MTTLTWISLLFICLGEVIGRIPAALSQMFLGFVAALLMAHSLQRSVCALLSEDFKQFFTTPLIWLMMIPSCVGLAWYVETVYWYCMALGFIIGAIYSGVKAVVSFGDLCNKGSDALIEKHSEIGAIGG
ncbi:hypothetical protein IPM19_04990 [bacterium]|nr:MAG: hypothetical protein IPM19_04990 [bacterium]